MFKNRDLWSYAAHMSDQGGGVPSFIPMHQVGPGNNGNIMDSGAQGGGNQSGGQQGQPQPGQNNQQGNLVGEGEGESDAFDFAAMFGDDADEDDDTPPADPLNPDDTVNGVPTAEGISAERATAVETEVKTAIGKMGIPASFIPDNFDASDRTQLNQLLNRTMQATVAQTMSVVFKPVQVALEHAIGQIHKQVDAKISQTRDGMAAQSIMESIVPEFNNPKFRPMISSMDSQLKSKGRKPQERAKAIRKMLNQMGINEPGDNGTRRSSTPGGNAAGATMRTGKAALDSFFGAFTPPKA
jgi:hypothetical protein